MSELKPSVIGDLAIQNHREELQKLIEQRERESKPKKWPLEHCDLYQISQESRQKALYILQNKLQKEKRIKKSRYKTSDYDPKLAEFNDQMNKRIETRVKQIENRTQSVQNPKKTKNKLREPIYMKRFKYYVDLIETNNSSQLTNN